MFAQGSFGSCQRRVRTSTALATLRVPPAPPARVSDPTKLATANVTQPLIAPASAGQATAAVDLDLTKHGRTREERGADGPGCLLSNRWRSAFSRTWTTSRCCKRVWTRSAGAWKKTARTWKSTYATATRPKRGTRSSTTLAYVARFSRVRTSDESAC